MANPNIVSVTSIYGGNAAWALTNTVTTTLMTVAADVIVKINSIIVTNIHASNAATVSIDVNGMGSGTTGVTVTGPLATCRLANLMNVPQGDSLVLIDKPIYLMEADVLRGGASAASVLELFASYEVINDA
tara:strand:- start:2398 stop:2790 length:393 start_codon:yes stop_codon:yes gene_type:complete